MAATHTSTTTMKTMTTCRTSVQLTRQPSNLSNYEGYHGDETASVPFMWESQPGTPKHHFPQTTLPPLTPPPSYFSSSSTPRSILKGQKNKNASASKSNHLLQSILPKRTARKGRGAPPPPSPPANSWPSLSFSSSSSLSSSSSSSLSYQSWQRSRSVPSTPMRRPRKGKEDEDPYDDVPSSGTCFGNAGFRGRYSSMIKKVMLGDFL